MNLEDFKSFCRVLIPSEVGSIPTHSRQALVGVAGSRFLGALFLGGLLLGALVPARPAAAQTSAGPEELRPSPFGRAVRSAMLPGWGQVNNGKPTKAMVLVSLQTYLYGRIVVETREAGEADRRADRLMGMDTEDPTVAALLARTEATAQEHYNTRRDLIFWSILGAFYSAMDAYIDANLGELDKELEKDRTLFGRLDPEEGTLEFGMRF